MRPSSAPARARGTVGTGAILRGREPEALDGYTGKATRDVGRLPKGPGMGELMEEIAPHFDASPKHGRRGAGVQRDGEQQEPWEVGSLGG